MAKKLDWQNVYEMLDNMLSGIAVFALQKEKIELLYLNKGGFRMLGYSEELGYRYLNNLVSVIVEEDKPKFWQAIEDVLKDNGAVDLEIRTVTAMGSMRWLQIRGNLYMNTDGGAVMLCVFLDATDRKFVENELRIQSEWYQMLLETEGEVLFDYNVISDVLNLKRASEYGIENNDIFDNYLTKMRKLAGANSDAAKMLEMIDTAIRNPSTQIVEMKTRLSLDRIGDTSRWYRIHITGIAGVDGYVTHVVGKITDINKQKLLEEELREKNKLDLLTGWLNREEAKAQIKNALQASDEDREVHAFILVDLSSFRFVSESLGSKIGDKMLRDVTAKIGKGFKRADILGRINGDEFILFVQNVGNSANLDVVASRVSRSTEYVLGDGDEKIVLSGRVGVSVYPYQGVAWDDLLGKADKAVNSLRASGKEGYHIHDLAGIYQAERQKENLIVKLVNDEITDEISGDKFEDTLKCILREPKWNDNLVRAFLKLIVRHYNFHKAFLGITSPESKMVKNFSFYENGFLPQSEQEEEDKARDWIDFLKRMDMLDGFRIIHSYDPIPEELSLYMIRNGIRCAVIKPMYIRGKIAGVLVLGECRGGEFNLKRDAEAEFKRVLHLVQSCVLRYERQMIGRSSLHEVGIVDDFDSYAFAVDYDSYELSYANQKMLNELPNLQMGDYCYHTFAGIDRPCDLCIMKRLDRNDPHARYSEERFSTALRSWLKAHASWIQNDEKSATCLLNCMDISEYFIGLNGTQN